MKQKKKSSKIRTCNSAGWKYISKVISNWETDEVQLKLSLAAHGRKGGRGKKIRIVFFYI